MILKNFFIKLGLDVDAMSFAKGQLAADALKAGLMGVKGAVVSAFGGLNEAFIGFNARAEANVMKFATIIGMNLKTPFEEAKVAASALFKGLQEDAAKTPAETEELVNFATGIGNAYMTANKSIAGLRELTTGAVVASKALGMEGIAQLDITQALTTGIHAPDRFGNALLGGLGMKREAFNKKSVQERLKLLTSALTSPTIKAAMAEFESSWAGVTSTLSDNAKIIAGQVGKPLFEFLKKVLGGIGNWVQKNKDRIVRFLTTLAGALMNVGRAVYEFGRGLWWLVSTVVQAAVQWFMSFGKVLGVTGTAAAAFAAAMLLLGRATTFALARFLLVFALLGLLVVLIDEVVGFFNGDDGLIAEWGDKWLDFLSSWIKEPSDWWLVRKLKEALDFIINISDRWKEFLAGIEAENAEVRGADGKSYKRTDVALQSELDAVTGRQTFDAKGRFIPYSGAGDRFGRSFWGNVSGPVAGAMVHVMNKVDITLHGSDEEQVQRVKKVIEEHHEKVMRLTREALAQ